MHLCRDAGEFLEGHRLQLQPHRRASKGLDRGTLRMLRRELDIYDKPAVSDRI